MVRLLRSLWPHDVVVCVRTLRPGECTTTPGPFEWTEREDVGLPHYDSMAVRRLLRITLDGDGIWENTVALALLPWSFGHDKYT